MLVSMPMAITVKAVLAANKREAQAEERSEVFLFLAVSMFTNQCPLERKEDLLMVIFELPVQTSEGNET